MRLPRIRLVWPLPRLPRRKEPGIGEVRYAPRANGRADPGEVVWAWVPFEEDSSRGKDRPVLVLARRGGELLTLPLTSKDHDLDRRQENLSGPVLDGCRDRRLGPVGATQRGTARPAGAAA